MDRSPAESFANIVLRQLRAADPIAGRLELRARGKTAIVGVVDADLWVPLFRLSNPSNSFNVMSLDVRHHQRWEPTYTRGVPADIVSALIGPLRFTWQAEVSMVEELARTSDPEH